jgi:hypothetical protein
VRFARAESLRRRKTVLWSLDGREKNFVDGKIDYYNKQPTDARKALFKKAFTLSFFFLSLKYRLLYVGDIDAFSFFSRLFLL